MKKIIKLYTLLNYSKSLAMLAGLKSLQPQTSYVFFLKN